MRMLLSTVFVLAILTSTAVGAQTDLDQVDAKLKRVVESHLPGWKQKRVEPIGGSKNVLVLFWSNSNRVVKVSVIAYKTGHAAWEAIEDFAMHEPSKEELKDLGDEGYAWGYDHGNVAFRRGKFIFYLSTDANIDDDPDARSLTALEKNERMRSERRRWSREFARHAAKAIDTP
jgi:hypothetical protein